MILIVFYTYFWPIKAFKSANITLEVPEIKMGVGVKTTPPLNSNREEITWDKAKPVFYFQNSKNHS